VPRPERARAIVPGSGTAGVDVGVAAVSRAERLVTPRPIRIQEEGIATRQLHELIIYLTDAERERSGVELER
jgi:hypothetical protein